MSLQNIAQMSYNPAMGGVQGTIVREIDALGGYSSNTQTGRLSI
jgi:tRNA uridine 5-carboxymethylaminomethyl modification enzyme